MFEASIWDLECADRRRHVSRHFRLLTWQALPSPCARVFPDGGPDEFGAHHLSGPLDPGMSETVNRVEDAATRWVRDVGSIGAVADVDDQLGAANIDRFEIHSRSNVVPELPEFRIERLLSRDFLPVDAEIPDCGDDAV